MLDVFAIIAFVIICASISVPMIVKIIVFAALLVHFFYSLYHITDQPSTLKEKMEYTLQRNLDDSIRYGMTTPGSPSQGTGKDAHRTRAYMAPKEMQSWLRARTVSSDEEAKLDAETEFRMQLRRVDDLKWDTYKKIEEAEERLYKYEGKQLRIPVVEKEDFQGRTCINCGSNMSWNRESKILVCPFCGKTQTLSEKAGKPTLKDIDMALEDGLYPKASAMVVELRKENKTDPQLILRSLRCSLRTSNISQALFEERKNPVTLQKILDRSEWDLLSETLPNRSKDFPRKAKKYCILSMRLLGVEPTSKAPTEEEQSEITKPVAPSYSYDSSPAEIVIWILSALFVGVPCIYSIIWPVLKEDSGKILLAFLFLFFTAIFVAIVALSLIAAYNWLTGAGLPDGGRTMKSLSKQPTAAEIQKAREMRRQQEEQRDQLFAELQELEKDI